MIPTPDGERIVVGRIHREHTSVPEWLGMRPDVELALGFSAQPNHWNPFFGYASVPV